MFLKQFNRTDRTILAVAIFFLLVSGLLLFDDSLLNFNDKQNSADRIGDVSDSARDVRKKLAGQLFWQPAHDNESVHEGDSVFTGANSSVTVNLDDGSSLTIEPNSLITFRRADGQMELDLKQGRVKTQFVGDSKIKLHMPCSKDSQDGLEVSGAGSSVVVDSDCKVQQLSGKAQIAGAAKSIETIAPIEKIIWSPPPPTQHAHFNFNRELKLAWNKSSKIGRYKVQFSKDQNFSLIHQEFGTTVQSWTSPKYPAEGSFYVRITLEDVNKKIVATSDSQKIEFINLEKPSITAPADGYRIELPLTPDGKTKYLGELVAGWEFRTRSEFKVLITSTENQNLVQAKTLEGNTTTMTNLSPGLYELVVQELTFSGGKDVGRSKPVPFSVVTGERPKLPAPRLITKTISHELPKDTPPELKWESVAGADQYLIQWTSEKNFDQALEHRQSNTQFPIEKIKVSNYRYRVAAVTASGFVGEFSSVGELEVKAKTPELLPVEPIVIQGENPEDPEPRVKLPITWNSPDEVESYQVELSTDEDFTDPTSIQAQSKSTTLELPKSGEYHFRVRATNLAGEPLTPFSAPGKVKYTYRIPLAKPKLVEPLSEITLFFQKDSKPYFWLEWSSVPNADTYTIEISKQPGFENRVMNVTSKSSRLLITSKLPQGRLYWRVKAENREGKTSSWSETRGMSIFSGRLPASDQ